MITQLNQALVLTLVGMGMTFAALGLLVLGMYAMTALITDKPRRKKASAEEAPAEEPLVTEAADVALHLAATRQSGAEVDENRRRAAAVAVAVALEGATAEDCRYRAAAAAVAMAVASASAASVPTNVPTMPDVWDHHVRSQYLTQRQRWVSRSVDSRQ